MGVHRGNDAVAVLLGRDDFSAPPLLLAEIGHARWKKGMRGELADRATYAAQLGLVVSLVTTVDDRDLMPRALDLALPLAHPIYDCVYLALAERDGARMVTADRRFADKVKASPFAELLELLA